jgi:hypothetical protein
MALAVVALSACTGEVGLAHGDPGHEAVPAPPPATATAPDAPAATATTAASAAVSGNAPAKVQTGAISAVTVTFSDHAQELAAADPRLNPDAIAIAIEHELQSHQMYAPAAANVHRSLAITVENFSNSLASNTKILGFTFRNAMLDGLVQVQDACGATQLPAFDVTARVRTSTRAADAEEDSLDPLYKSFAAQLVEGLRSAPPPP